MLVVVFSHTVQNGSHGFVEGNKHECIHTCIAHTIGRSKDIHIPLRNGALYIFQDAGRFTVQAVFVDDWCWTARGCTLFQKVF